MSITIRRGTTPTLNFTISNEGFDASLVRDLRLTIYQGSKQHDFGMDDVSLSENVISKTFTQEETLAFENGTAFFQLKVLFPNHKVGGTKRIPITIGNMKNEEVM